MPRRYVRNLVRHHPGKFRFLVCRHNQSRVDIEEAAWEREGIQLVRVNHLNSEGHLGIGVAYQVLPNTIDVLRDDRILNQLDAGLHLLGILLAHADLALNGVPVAHAAPADLAVANGVHVILAPVMLDLAVVLLRHHRRF